MKQKVNLQFIKTSSILYDDRLRKVSSSIARSGRKVKIYIVDDTNLEGAGYLEDGIEYRIVSLISRRLFKSKKMLWIKIVEYSLRNFFIFLKEQPSSVWVHDMDGFLTVILIGFYLKFNSSRRKIIFDLHELPPDMYFDRAFHRYLLKLALKLSSCRVTANQDRWNYMIEKLKINASTGHTALYNFPSISLSLKVKEELPNELKSWLKGDSYLLFQGAALKGRLFKEILSAVSGTTDYKLVVLGPIEAETLNEIKLNYGATLDAILYVTGWVPQDDLYLYVDHALGSLVFYRNSSLNNWFCAPNRLYYSLARGVPVLCGNNPEMKAAIEGSGAGLVADTDGSDQIALDRGLTMFLAGIECFRIKAQASRNKYFWESQDNLITSALELH